MTSLTQENTQSNTHYPVIIIGGGQAGLSVSYYLQEQNIDHLILEKNSMMHGWKHERWDSFTLVTPNWQCDLPGHPYDGDDPKGFMKRDQIINYLDRFIEKIAPCVEEGVRVEQVTTDENGLYYISTSKGHYTADQVVVASGGYHIPIIPRMAERIPNTINQVHSAQYKHPDQLSEGAILVVGSGQSGAQIAEDLHLAGRKVFLATGDAPRVARVYRGKDVVEWLDDMGYYDMSVDEHSLGKNVRNNTNHYVTGRDGGRDIDLRLFSKEGMELFGLMTDYQNGELHFQPNLTDNLDKADHTYNNINKRIDQWITQQKITTKEGPSTYRPQWEPQQERTKLTLEDSGITTILWCIGYSPDFSWLDSAVFNGQGHPKHHRGVSPQDGLYFIGLPWLHTWGSGRFSGVKHDAKYLVQHMSDYKRSQNKLTENQLSATA